MKTRAPGRTGIQVSPYCLGTMMFGRDAVERLVPLAQVAGLSLTASLRGRPVDECAA